MADSAQSMGEILYLRKKREDSAQSRGEILRLRKKREDSAQSMGEILHLRRKRTAPAQIRGDLLYGQGAGGTFEGVEAAGGKENMGLRRSKSCGTAERKGND